MSPAGVLLHLLEAAFSFFFKVGSGDDGGESVRKRLETCELVQMALTHTWWPLVFCDIGEPAGL